MKKIIFTLIALIWIISLIILIIALTDLYPDSILKEYRSSVGIAFITITGLLKLLYNAVKKKEKSDASTLTQQK